jgi:hypothetical protein
VPTALAAAAKHIASVFVLHSLAEPVNAQAVTVFRLVGSLHFGISLQIS